MPTRHLVLALAAALAAAGLAAARIAAPPPVAQRVAAADLVVVGKVASVGDRTVPAELEAGDTRQLKTATVEVSEALLGGDVKKVTVGFVAPPTGRSRYPVARLEKGQEALLALVKHPTKKDFYVLAHYYDVVSKDSAEDVAEARRVAKVLTGAKANLASKDAELRYEAAALLVLRYKTAPGSAAKLTPLATAESKPILLALAEADWEAMARKYPRLAPSQVFYRLGVGEADGWQQPGDFAKVPAAMKEWLRENAGKYRIRAYLRPGDRKEEPAGG